MKEEIENNDNKVDGKDREIKQLREKLSQHHELVIVELRAQNEFYKQSIEELKEQMSKLNSNAMKIANYEEQLEKQKKSIDQQAQQIQFELKNEINICAKKLNSCEEKPVYRGCTDIADAPGIHKISPDQEGPFDVLCDRTTAGPGWTVIQQRINGKEDFYRDWATCREGFGAFHGDFFLGLEKIHRLTRAQLHELYIHMEGFDGDINYRKYAQFAISGEKDQYTLITLGKSEGSATDDLLQHHKDHKFTTYDRDNDNLNSGNCAIEYGGGWWYDSYTAR
ncbi:ficolin-1-like [Drosophila montana]|uniref:ficolin-1-like n=1 Tax=Drosophila montana TaxID=40370 RepID=UPI00313E9E21